MCREAGRIVLIPFHPPDESQPSTDDSELLLAQKTCGDAVCFVVALGEAFLSSEGRAMCGSIQQWVEKEVHERAEKAGVANQINARLHKTYSLLLFFTIKVSPSICYIKPAFVLYQLDWYINHIGITCDNYKDSWFNAAGLLLVTYNLLWALYETHIHLSYVSLQSALRLLQVRMTYGSFL